MQRMTRHYKAKKDAITCEKLWGAGNKLRTRGIRMGEPTYDNTYVLYDE